MSGCPSCDRDLSWPGQPGHRCYTYAEHRDKTTPLTVDPRTTARDETRTP